MSIESINKLPEKQENKNTIIQKITNEVLISFFVLTIKGEQFYKKIKDKKTYLKIKHISFHVSKTELKETYQMIKLLLKRKRTDKEIQFIKDQLGDLGKMGVLGTSGIVPGGFIIMAICYKLGIDLKPSAYKEIEEKK